MVQKPSSSPKAPLLERQRLLNSLAQARQHRCVLLRGPAGCGKSTLLAAWRPALMASGAEVAWIRCERQCEDVAAFIDTLIAALAEIDASITREAALLAGRGSDAELVERLVIALVRGVVAHRRPIVLFLDDAHLLRDAHVREALQWLLDYAPPCLQIALATREPLPLSLSRLRAQDQLLELGYEQLRFSPAESAELLRALVDGITAPEVHRLHTLSDGWAAGLHLLALETRAGRRDGRAAARRAHDADAFTHYVDRHLLVQLLPPERELLVCCAAVDAFSAPLATALLAPEVSSAQSQAALERLVQAELFFAPVEGAEGWWRMQPLLRSLMAARFDEWPLARRQHVHAVAAHWLAGQQRLLEAVPHAVAAGAAREAAQWVAHAAPGLFARAQLRHLVRMLLALPTEVLDERPELELWLAWADIYEHRLRDCRQRIEKLRPQVEEGAQDARAWLLLLESALAVQSDDVTGALALLPRLQTESAAGDPLVRAGRRNLLTWLHLQKGEYEQARQIQQEAPVVIHGDVLVGTEFGMLFGRCMVGLTYAVEGQVIRAERVYRDVLEEAERRGPSCIEAACAAAALLAEVLYELNDLSGVAALLEDRLDVLEQVSIPDTVFRVLIMLARTRWAVGRPLDAFGCLDRLEDYAERFELERLLAFALVERLQYHLRQDDPQAARACMARLAELEQRHPRTRPDAMVDVVLANDRARIHLALHGGDLGVARERLHALITLCLRHGRRRRVTTLQLQLAMVEQQLGRPQQALVHVGEALRNGHELGLLRAMLDADPSVPQLVQQALATGTLNELAAFHAERLLEAARSGAGTGGPIYVTAGPAAAPVCLDSLLNEREMGIARLLAHAMPNKKIARALGLSPETIKWHLKNIYGKLGVSGRDEVAERLRAELLVDGVVRR